MVCSRVGLERERKGWLPALLERHRRTEYTYTQVQMCSSTKQYGINTSETERESHGLLYCTVTGQRAHKLRNSR